MPSIGLNVTLIGLTAKKATNQSILNFYIEENIGEREPNEFWVETSHDSNNAYLTNFFNQNMRSTTVILVGMIYYIPPVIDEITREETTPEKHILDLEDKFIIYAYLIIMNTKLY